MSDDPLARKRARSQAAAGAHGGRSETFYLRPRNLKIAGRRTSIRLEPEMWSAFEDICRRERSDPNTLATRIARSKPRECSFTAAVRIYIVSYYRTLSEAALAGAASHADRPLHRGRPS
jgi:predicted DNA-binding ribbon-helix-helix protein